MKKTRTYREVVAILENNRISPTTKVSPRDSDTELIVQMLQLVHRAEFNTAQLEIIRSLNFESITRARRKLQEGGAFLPSVEISKKRRLKSFEIQQIAPKESAASIQQRIEVNA